MTDIHSTIEEWRKNLLDLTRRNSLINCRFGSRGAIRLVAPGPEEVWQRICVNDDSMTFAWKNELVVLPPQSLDGASEEGASSPPLSSSPGGPAPDTASSGRESEVRTPTIEQCLASPLYQQHLLTDMSDRKLDQRLRRMRMRSSESLSEQGVHSLFLAFGLLKWFESHDSDVDCFSPLMLVPVDLKRATVGAPWTMKEYEDEVVPNYCLAQLLREQFGVEMPPLPTLQELEATGARAAYLEAVRESVSEIPRWGVEDAVLLNNFSFQKVAMWQDLGANVERIADHDLCRAIAGDKAALVTERVHLPAPEEFDDRVPPQDLHTILDCDSSQLEAILAARAGMNLVLDGPPGTGKSQTIANLIAEFLAAGKTVLFVSEKAAALEVVKRRLDQKHLGDFCLECHSHNANKKTVLQELKRCLELEEEQYSEQDDHLQALLDVRTQLNAYVRALHQRREPLGITAFEAHGRLARLGDQRPARVAAHAVGMTASDLTRVEKSFAQLLDSREVIEALETYPWRGCLIDEVSLSAEQDVKHHLERLADRAETVGRVFQELVTAGVLTAVPTARSLDEERRRLQEALKSPPVPARWFPLNTRQLAHAVLQAAEAREREGKLRVELDCYRDDVEQSFPDEAARRLLDGREEASLAGRWKIPQAATVRGQIEQLAEVSRGLNQLADQCRKVETAIADVVTRLTIGLSKPPRLKNLSRLLAVAHVIADTGALREVWFDAKRRAEIRVIAEKCAADVDRAESIRREHATRFMPQAFDRDARELVQEAAGFESLWKRWFGGFKAFQRRAGDLYVDEPPLSTSEFLADFQSLRDFHKAAAAPRRFEEEMPEALVSGPAGNTDWRRILTGLDSVEQLCGMISVSDELRTRLCSEGAIRRDELSDAATQLDEATRELNQALEELGQKIDLAAIGADATPGADVPVSELAAWSLEVAASVNQRLADLREVASQLREDRDVELAHLEEQRRHWSDLRKMRKADRRASGILEECDIRYESGPDPEHVAAAQWLKETLDRCHGEIPPASAAVAGSDEIRELVTESLETIRTTLDDQFLESWEFLRKQVFPIRKPVSVGITIVLEPFDRLAEWFRRMLEELPGLNAWMRYRESRAALQQLGLEGVLEEVLQGDYPIDAAWPAFQARFYRQWLDGVYREDGVLRNFNVGDHERNLEEFRNLDRRSIEAGHCRIRTRLLSDPHRPHAEGIDVPNSSELGVLLHECNKKNRHLPLRELFRKIPSVLMRLKPCLMMSPLAVSTYLQNPDLVFDLVIFDEASQVRPFDAVGAIYRGRQLVVAGDQRQLPPTNFFERMGAEEDEAAADEEGIVMSEYESILDICLSLQVSRKRLRWHYRSKREPLIAFSNHYFYNNDLVTFPSVFDVDGQTAVSHVYVPDGCWKSGGGGGINEIEAQRTAELVFEHFRNSPHKSLGVITFNQRQQLAVDDCLQELRKVRPEYESHFDTDRAEPLFIKNLENVQGDERDVILMSLGYGFDQHGKFHRRFGPLAREGGERRLNVAVTRAREQIILVSSIRSHDLDVSGLTHVGPKLLKAYLEFAERGVETLGAQREVDADAEFDSPFEQEVYEALRRKGLQVHTQVGCGGYRIDLAIVHPQRPGSYVLGVECDGVAYHSSRTARDRDRLRQEVLENGLGWRIVRVWSTDWIASPHSQVQRVLAAYQQAISTSDDASVQQDLASDDVDLAPRYVSRNTGDGPRPNFSTIEEVPEGYLAGRLQDIARRLGATQRDDLIRSVARDLGFARTGSRIRQRIDDCLRTQIADRVLTEDADGRVSLGADAGS
ncbi:hypothetical protein Mal4_35430 [Maioricimonas rarisocia]|uniref:Uncharacterized protein n=1 Tax=Maioricimonas rarisocia TaxID=2528026 RepID=A0A517Z9P2_9PLAN|nr:DUF4011 domain-containing protein [Maioricimonas rarisocia]QDU39206.1 hypothetical protein Mal4_35430 [Maioricimonas rarisocia]